MADMTNINVNYRLYVPTMLVIGLHGWILPPIGIILCDFVVYSGETREDTQKYGF